MYYAFYFLNNFFLCHVRTKRSKPRHEAAVETASDTECDARDDSLMSPKSSSSSERYNSKDMRVNCNNVVSLRHLALAGFRKDQGRGYDEMFRRSTYCEQGLHTVHLDCKWFQNVSWEPERQCNADDAASLSGSVLLGQSKHGYYLGNGPRRAPCRAPLVWLRTRSKS
jgi:hypothetical protein